MTFKDYKISILMRGRYKLIIIGLFFFHVVQAQPIELAKNGKSDYSIYISVEAGDLIKQSAKEFQKYFYQISGAKLDITNHRKTAYQIVLGDISFIKDIDPYFDTDVLKPGGYRIKTEQSFLLISGIDEEGVSNGVYGFFEEFLDCRYYATDAVVIPKRSLISLTNINEFQNPAFEFRIVWSSEAFSPDYCRWNKLTFPPRINPRWSKMWVHTTNRYVNPDKYYSTNPEMFMLANNKRSPKDINFSSNAALRIVTDSIASVIRTHPRIEYFSVSQADENQFGICRCHTCNILRKKYGTESAVIIDFVNRVALTFPSKTVTTLAYHYSRKPPINYYLEENVLVFVCNTNPDRRIAANLHNGKDSFLSDLKGWRRLTDEIVVWDYAGNMSFPYMPFPNLFLLQKNLLTFSDLDIKGVFEQCPTQNESEFNELRSFLLAKLLWNPHLNVDSLITDFLHAYYGAAAPYLKEYIGVISTAFMNSDRPLSRTTGPAFNVNSFLSIEHIERYQEFFQKAKSKVKDNKLLLSRIDKLEQSLRFAKLEIYNFYKGKTSEVPRMSIMRYNQLLSEFKNKANQYGQERILPSIKSPDDYFQLRENSSKKQR